MAEDESDNTVMAEIKRMMKHGLQHRYQDGSVKKLLDVFTFLDPWYKFIIDEAEDELLALEGDMILFKEIQKLLKRFLLNV